MTDVRPARAEVLFRAGFSCAQAVVQAFCEDFDVPAAVGARASCAFGAGVCGRAGMCGVASGALIVIGLAHGRVEAADVAARDRTYALSREFLARFAEVAGAVDCRDILGVDISTPEGAARARAAGAFDTRCPALVREGSGLLAALLRGRS
jgi:C_GCAxxG_C_C family probable redox protein